MVGGAHPPCRLPCTTQHPFIYDPSAKSKILQLESGNKMSHEFEDAVLRSIFIGATCPYLVLKVRRTAGGLRSPSHQRRRHGGSSLAG